MAKQDPLDRAFTEIWDETLSVFNDQLCPNFNRREKRNSLFKLRHLSSARRELQAAVAHTIAGALDSDRELLDVFSGDATSTMPLAMAGKLDRLVLIDSGSKGDPYKQCVEVMKRKGLDKKVELKHLHILPNVDPKLLPAIRQVVIPQTGLGLPDSAKIPSANIELDPRYHRSHQLYFPNMNLNNVLTVLFANDQERVVHLMDAPYYRSTVRLEQIKAFVESQLPQNTKIRTWSTIHNTPLYHAEVVKTEQ